MKLLTGLLGVLVGGIMLLHIVPTSPTKVVSMSDCPTAAHHDTLCAFAAAAHIDAWHALFLAIAPVAEWLLSIVSAVAILATTLPFSRPHCFSAPPLLPQQLRERTYRFSWRPWQDLFSRGLLHPKLF